MKADPCELLKKAEKAYESYQTEEAISILIKLANENIPEACMKLGFIYRTSEDIGRDLAKSNMWYSKYRQLLKNAALQGAPEAMFQLGKIYQYGNNVNIDNEKALNFIKKSAELNFAEAVFHFANLYKFGWCGVVENLDVYNKWLEKAVELEYPEALYYKGIDIIHNDYETGLSFIEKSSAAGFFMFNKY